MDGRAARRCLRWLIIAQPQWAKGERSALVTLAGIKRLKQTCLPSAK